MGGIENSYLLVTAGVTVCDDFGEAFLVTY